MKMKHLVLATMLACSSAQAMAGGFVNLPSVLGGTGANAFRQVGSANNAADKFYLGGTSDAAVVGTFNSVISGYTLLDTITTDLIGTGLNVTGPGSIGTFIDKVYRNNTDNTLIFASRLELEADSGVEINDIFRKGFANNSVSVAWFNETVNDFRLKDSARTHQGFFKQANGTIKPDTLDLDYVDFRTDTSAPESNPLSGWYLIKTNATAYTQSADAVSIWRGNQEANGSITEFAFNGFTVAAQVVTVPENDTYAMLLAGLGIMGFVARRKSA